MQGQPANHYAVLGLDRHCTAGQIREAYRILAKKFHPDLNSGSEEASAHTQLLNAAYEVLNDPESRRAYDELLKNNAREKAPARAGRLPRSISQDVQLKLEEFLRGASLEVRVNDPGNPEGPEVYALEIPPGTSPGARFRVPRDGEFGGGHVVVRVRARPDFRFKVRGSDLRCDLRISPRRAAQGGSEFVRGITGSRLRVAIPAGVTRGEVVRIAGEGLPKARGGRGDLLVRVIYKPEIRISRAK